MVTRFNRRGHYRTNASGTRSYVRPHEVEKEYFSIKDSSGQLLINGKARLKETRCRHCYNKVYHAALSTTKNIYFNNDTEPLIKHVCLKPEARIIEREGALKQPKKFLSDSEIVAYEKRKEIENRNQVSNDRLKKDLRIKMRELTRTTNLKSSKSSNIKQQLFYKNQIEILQLEKKILENIKSGSVSPAQISELRAQIKNKKKQLETTTLTFKKLTVQKPNIKSSTENKGHRPAPQGEEREAYEKIIEQLKTKIEEENDDDIKETLLLDKLKNEQALTTTWTDFMLIRDKILKIKSERENRGVHLEKQKTPEQKKQEIKNKISQFTHAIKMQRLEGKEPNPKIDQDLTPKLTIRKSRLSSCKQDLPIYSSFLVSF